MGRDGSSSAVAYLGDVSRGNEASEIIDKKIDR